MMQPKEVADRLEVLNLEGEYARTWHTGDAEGWAALFTEDGSYEHLAAGDLPGGKAEGRDQLAELCRGLRSEGNDVLHLMHLPSLSFEGDRAQGWIPFEVAGVMQAPVLSRLTGVYHVVYARTPDGWRIQQRASSAMWNLASAFYGGGHGTPGQSQ